MMRKDNNASVIQESKLYQEFLKERNEILKHKWLMSERAGTDIGFEAALLSWVRRHRSGWKASRRGEKALTRFPKEDSIKHNVNTPEKPCYS